jgi:hypothetical protein
MRQSFFRVPPMSRDSARVLIRVRVPERVRLVDEHEAIGVLVEVEKVSIASELPFRSELLVAEDTPRDVARAEVRLPERVA